MVSISPYRTNAKPPKQKLPRELVYVTRDHERHVGPARKAFEVLFAGAIVGCTVSMCGLPDVASVIVIFAVLVASWRWRRAPDTSAIVLRVERGALEVHTGRRRSRIARVRLTDLDRVSLDSKSIRKVEPSHHMGSALRFIETSVGPEVDVARIVLVPSGQRAPIQLTDAFVAHMDCVESLSKIRLFLRKHGWRPLEERDAIE